MSAIKRSSKDPRRASPRHPGLPAVLVDDRGVVTHRIVPVEEYDALMALQKSAGPSESFMREAAAIFTSKRTRWHKAEDVLPELIASGIAEMRKRQGVTQAELGKRLGVPQSRISRMEKNEDAITLRVLKRLAKALASAKER